jgi:peptidoglycan/xylan/chitin deacetylase (PgdA/CDA1 family)
VYNRATKNISGGDFILMHPKEHSLTALPEILDYYKRQGLTTVTVSECLG